MSAHVPLSVELRMIAGRVRRSMRNLGHRPRRAPASFRPVFIITSERTGSNLLVDYLRSLPDVDMVGEVLSPLLPIGIRTRFVSRRAVLRHLRRTLQGLDGTVVGSKLMFWHLHEIHDLSVEDLRTEFPDARFIILYRASLADQYVSHRIAEETGQFLVRERGKRRVASIVVDPNDFAEYSTRIRAHYDRVVSVPWMKERGVIVSYRELVDDPESLMRDRLAPCLSVSYVPPRSTLVRQNPAPLREKVVNYLEVENILTGSDAVQSYSFGDDVRE